MSARVGHHVTAFQIGIFGVDIFFVLSGFVMAHVSASTWSTRGSYLRRRLTRLLPLYWGVSIFFFLAAFLAPDLSGDTVTLQNLMKSMFFIPYLRESGLVQPLVFLGWTLNYEMLFYLLFAIGLGARRSLLPILIILLSLVVVGHVLRPSYVVLVFWSDPILLEFAAGILCWKFYVRLKTDPIAGHLGLVLIPGGILTVFLLYLLFPLESTHRIFVFLIPAVMIVTGTALAPSLPGKPAYILIALGDASYAIYLVHPYILGALVKVLPLALPFALSSLVMVVLVCVISGLVFTRFERPAMNAIYRIRIKKAQPA